MTDPDALGLNVLPTNPLSKEERALLAKKARNRKSSKRWRTKKAEARKAAKRPDETSTSAVIQGHAEENDDGGTCTSEEEPQLPSIAAEFSVSKTDALFPSASDAEARASQGGDAGRGDAGNVQDRPIQLLAEAPVDAATSLSAGDNLQLLQVIRDTEGAFLEGAILRAFRYSEEQQGLIDKQHSRISQLQDQMALQVDQLEQNLEASENMLHEFKRLGKIKEANLKRRLHRIASYSVIPDGFQKHKSDIGQLCEEVMDELRNGPIMAKDIASKFLGMIDMHPSWNQTQTPSVIEVMKAFAESRDSTTLIQLPAPPFGRRKSISVQEASHASQEVCIESYVVLLQLIQAELPTISGVDSDAAGRSHARITILMSVLVSLVTSWILAQSASFSSLRAIKTSPLNPQSNALQKVLAGLDPAIRAQMWRYWDDFCLSTPALMARVKRSESQFDELLAEFDEAGESSMIGLVSAVQDLMEGYYKLFEQSYILDTRCALLFDPVQLAILCALHLPELPLPELLALETDPFFRFTQGFIDGTIPPPLG